MVVDAGNVGDNTTVTITPNHLFGDRIFPRSVVLDGPFWHNMAANLLVDKKLETK